MTSYRLAIPAVSLLFFALQLLTRAQTNPDISKPPAGGATQVHAPAPNLSQEELARLYLVKKQYHEAEEIFRRLTREHPKNAVYWNELGISLHNQMELDAALKCYQKASKLDSHYADPVNNIGTIWYERKRFAKAIRAYQRAISLRNDFAAFYLNLGYAYFSQKQYEESITAFRKALQIDPDSFEAGHSRTGTVIQDRTISSDRGRFYFLLAKSFAGSGNIERCVTYLRKARDEGYQDFNAIKSDPTFAAVMKDPAAQELFAPKPGEGVQP